MSLQCATASGPCEFPAEGQQFEQLPPEEVRICFAEDNRVNRKLAEKILEKMCYTNVNFFGDGLAAVEGVRQAAREGEPYHLVFMDIQMPVLGGFSATELIRSDEDDSIRNVKIIAMDPRPYSPDQIERYHSKGMDDFLVKPIRFNDYKGMMEKYANIPVCISGLHCFSFTDFSKRPVASTEPEVSMSEDAILDKSGAKSLWLQPKL